MNPHQMGPIARNNADGKKQLVYARCGLPSPRFALEETEKAKAEKLRAKGKPADLEELIRMEADRGSTNVRKLTFPHWTRWFGVEQRCIVPVISFAEPDPKSQEEGGKVPNTWFSRDESKPLMFLRGSMCRNGKASARSRMG